MNGIKPGARHSLVHAYVSENMLSNIHYSYHDSWNIFLFLFLSLSAYACANPFQPNMTVTHVRMLDFVQDLVYDFGDNVTYICEDGNETYSKRNYLFDDDELKDSFVLTCLDNGNWTDYPHFFCVHKLGT